MLGSFYNPDPAPAEEICKQGWSVPTLISLLLMLSKTSPCHDCDEHHKQRTQIARPNMSNKEIIHAYRHLYRAALKAVCYSQPASTVARNQLRGAFRLKDATFNERAVRRTIWFLKNAAKDTGIEHKIVKNLLMVKFWKDHVAKLDRPSWRAVLDGPVQKRTYVFHIFCLPYLQVLHVVVV